MLKDHYPSAFQSPYVTEYTRFANQLLRRLQSHDLMWFDKKDMEKVAVTLTLYFEDVLADAGIWHAFTDKMKAKYGRYVPFYDIDEDNYYRDEPNLEDVSYLIWNSLSLIRDTHIINPGSPFLYELAEEAVGMMDDAFEQMPVNEELKAFFSEAEFADDFYQTRDVLSWLVFDCYLTSNGKAYEQLRESVEEQVKSGNPDISADQYSYIIENHMAVSWKTGPLALPTSQWLAAIVRHNGRADVASALEAMQYRPMMGFRVCSAAHDILQIERADGERMALTFENIGISWAQAAAAKSGMAEFVCFRDEWYLNGTSAMSPNMTLYDEGRKQWEQEQRYGVPNYTKLIKDNGGSKLFYFKDIDAEVEFLDKKMGMKQAQAQKINTPQAMWNCTWTLFLPAADQGFDSYPNIAECINDARNPFYNADLAWEEASSMILNVSFDLAEYLVQQHLLPDANFPSPQAEEAGRMLFQDNFDFIIRNHFRERTDVAKP